MNNNIQKPKQNQKVNSDYIDTNFEANYSDEEEEEESEFEEMENSQKEDESKYENKDINDIDCSTDSSNDDDDKDIFLPEVYVNSTIKHLESNKGAWRVKLYKLDEKGNWNDIATGNAIILMNVRLKIFYIKNFLD